MAYNGIVTQARDTFLYRVYGYMMIGLLLSAVAAVAAASSPAFMTALFTSKALMFGLLIAQLAVVVVLTAMLNRLSFGSALFAYGLYAVLTGLTLSSIFVVYQLPSIGLTFLVTAGMFGTMALYGYVTKSDLSGMRNLLMMGLVGIILANIINIFWRNESFDVVIACVGVVVFTLLTAYDVQRIKWMRSAIIDEEMAGKAAIVGALMLYLDFVNLFLMLLRLLGRRRD